MRDDGRLVEVLADASERPMAVTPMRPMTEAEVEAAAASDPDARPFTPEDLAKARRVPRAKTLRRALGLTQEEFSTRYHIPLGTLRDWEQGRAQPDQPASAYLMAIAGDPEGRTSRAEGRTEARQGKTRLRPIVQHGSGFAGRASAARSCRAWNRTETSTG